MKALALFAIVCGCLFIYGFLMADKIRISTREESTTQFSVTTTLPTITASYRWISVHGCSAETTEENHTFCNGHWERESTQEVRDDQRQYVFPWRPVPRGMVQITAIAFDGEGRPLARGQTRVIR